MHISVWPLGPLLELPFGLIGGNDLWDLTQEQRNQVLQDIFESKQRFLLDSYSHVFDDYENQESLFG